MPELRTKIHCTLGPACREVEVLEAMIRAGADAFRVNGAFAGEADVRDWVGRVREASRAAGRLVGVLVDLPGPKFRVGELEGGKAIPLAVGSEFTVDASPEPGGRNRVPLRSMPYFEDVTRGAGVVLGDGQGRLVVLAAGADRLRVRVEEAGELRPGVSVHFPGLALPTAVPTKGDRALLRAAVEAGADMVCQSYVRTEHDMARLKEHLASLGARQTLAIAKIERVDAVERLDRILGRADGVVIGRGDLGIDAGVENVPGMQRHIVEAGRRAGLPVVVATEMLDSMTRGDRPTRAEASDVAGAVFDGVDGVMLSSETALGVAPVRVVETLARFLGAAEEDPTAPYAGSPTFPPLPARAGRPDQHVVRAAVTLARDTGAAAIVVFTRRGSSAVRISKERPEARIHAFASTEEVCRRLSLAWGVRSQPMPAVRGSDEVFRYVREYVCEASGLEPGDRVVLVMGGEGDPAGATTLIKLVTA